MSTPRYETYMSTDTIPLPYCPGCGHTTLVKALDQALVRLQPDPRKVVIVTDIGCIGLADRNFVTNAFHGLHGRSITYACGLKLARPELTVIALKGDGACGIGGTHLLNVARRNIGITLIVANNFNYGMTGGQHSVTTPTGGVTSTTPWGNVERPMDLCATTAAAGAAWVYRATTFDQDLPEVLARAISQPGFAMVDVWEQCQAYYAQRNKLRKSDLFGLLESCGFRLGLVADDPRPEYSARYHAAFEAGKGVLRSKPKIEPSFRAAVARQSGILIAGSAGQKIRSTATLLAEAGIACDLYATQKDDYPITVRTGHSVAEIILSPQRIDYTGIDQPDYLVALSQDGVKRTRASIASLPATSTVYTDAALDLPATAARVLRLPLAEAAQGIGKLSIGFVALGALLAESGLYPVEALAATIRAFQSDTIADASCKALAAGAELVRSTT